ncbi:hypothetical protein [Columbia Basin potato purple top phytoplasma]|uniref:Uncharacterized protein n=1 Tax=Columbia Basin potato purple top phytoplasma TaxID=307134 RepID=A0ABT5L991_9MOLU|nr:hypothetical protein [Columbia Basin potato purple top phytoplasma]MDC9032173.1 hypothetical protein [Columbia Basin potato purple top phytoplasma]
MSKLKEPPKSLLGVYFKPRINPFNERYPNEDNEYTLEELLKYETSIEETFVFWDFQEKPPQEEQSRINLVVSKIFTDQNKEEVINRYLIENNIIKEPKLIKLGCYNATQHTGLVLPLPSETFHEIDIDAIYFDDGIRILPENPKTQSLKRKLEWTQELKKQDKKRLNEVENESFKTIIKEIINQKEKQIKNLQQDIIKSQFYTIEDLLKLSNGAKNIYLFHFNVQKRKKIIELPDSLEPYQTIRDWKRENNLYTYPPLIKEGEYKEEIKEAEISFEITSPSYKKFNIPFKVKIVSHLFETDNTIYLIICNDSSFKIKLAEQYRTNYINWLNQCYIKYGYYYSGEEVRNKFGRSSRNIYDENGNSYYYKYVDGIFFDNWYIDGNVTAKTYYKFLDTTLPPPKPQELD